MIKGKTKKRTYQAIYRLLDRVSPVPFDCGMICGAACCVAGREADDTDAVAGAADNADLGIYLLPGEDKIHDKNADWLTWSTQHTDEFDFPPSWQGVVHFVRCNTPPYCPRERRPIQCRTFPLAPHLRARSGSEPELVLIYNDDDLPYCCPLIEDADEAPLDPCFVRATYTAWRHLIRDPLIRDLVEMDSRERDEADLAVVMTERSYFDR